MKIGIWSVLALVFSSVFAFAHDDCRYLLEKHRLPRDSFNQHRMLRAFQDLLEHPPRNLYGKGVPRISQVLALMDAGSDNLVRKNALKLVAQGLFDNSLTIGRVRATKRFVSIAADRNHPLHELALETLGTDLSAYAYQYELIKALIVNNQIPDDLRIKAITMLKVLINNTMDRGLSDLNDEDDDDDGDSTLTSGLDIMETIWEQFLWVNEYLENNPNLPKPVLDALSTTFGFLDYEGWQSNVALIARIKEILIAYVERGIKPQLEQMILIRTVSLRETNVLNMDDLNDILNLLVASVHKDHGNFEMLNTAIETFGVIGLVHPDIAARFSATNRMAEIVHIKGMPQLQRVRLEQRVNEMLPVDNLKFITRVLMQNDFSEVTLFNALDCVSDAVSRTVYDYKFAREENKRHSAFITAENVAEVAKTGNYNLALLRKALKGIATRSSASMDLRQKARRIAEMIPVEL